MIGFDDATVGNSVKQLRMKDSASHLSTYLNRLDPERYELNVEMY